MRSAIRASRVFWLVLPVLIACNPPADSEEQVLTRFLDLPGDRTVPGAEAGRREVYIRFAAESRSMLASLKRLLSVDNVHDGLVWAYTTSDRLEQLLDLGIDFQVLPHPGINPGARMGMLDKTGELRWDHFPTYSEYVQVMQQFASEHPDLCRLEQIGTSTNAQRPHELWALKISDNPDLAEDEPEVLYTSTMHGDETVGYMLLLHLIDELLNGYGSDPEITDMVNNLEIWINPLANPDGTYYAGDDTVDGAIRGFVNENGQVSAVDPNRNFPDQLGGDHPDGHDWWSETIAMMDFAAAHHFVISANFHGGAELVNYPWDCRHDRHPDDAWFIRVSRAYADQCHADGPAGYLTDLENGITDGYDWYSIDGGRQDFMNFEHGCREVTIELSGVKNPDASSLPEYWQANRQALIDYLNNALTGVRGVVTDADQNPLKVTVSVTDYDTAEAQSWVTSDPESGDYHRMLLPGTYTLRFAAEGWISREVTDVVVPEQGALRLNVVMTEAAKTTVVGLVTSCGDGLPLPGATVEIPGTGIPPVITRRSGDYRIPDVWENRHTFRVSASGFEPVEEERLISQNSSRQDFCLVRLHPVYSSDLERDDGDLVAQTQDGGAGWQWGLAPAMPGAHSGQRVFATDLDADYADNADWRLILAKVQLPKDGPALSFWHWYEVESGYDGGNLEISSDGGKTWSPVAPQGGYPDDNVTALHQPGYSGKSTGWVRAVFDLSAYAGKTVDLRFHFASDGSVGESGWVIDDLAVTGRISPD